MAGEFGTFQVKNASSKSLKLAEISGYHLEPGAEVDFLDPTLDEHYANYHDIKSAASMPSTSLCKQLKSGKLQVTLDLPPMSAHSTR